MIDSLIFPNFRVNFFNMKASLIIIGNEILSGKTIDTNSSFMAKELQKIGINVVEINTIPDEIEQIKNTISKVSKNTDIIITTGGIGPTKDDKTKTALKEYFEDELIFDEATFQYVKKILEGRGRVDILEKNREQAMVLSRAVIFQNDNGTAPCQMMEDNGKLLFSLPGVPFEVKPLVKDKLIPFLKNKFALNHIVNKTVRITGIPESLLSEILEEWELHLPSHIQLAYLPSGSTIELRLTIQGKEKEELLQQLNHQVEKIKPIIKDNVISYDGENALELLKSILIHKNYTISTAESCTAGEIARLLTSVSGSSAYYTGGVIPYDYHQKIKILGVKPSTIETETVVSEKVALEMAKGCQSLFDTTISIATTGVAGPSSDEFNNEIGLIHYAMRIKDSEYAGKMFLPHLEREDFVEFVSKKIIEKLILLLK